MRYKRGNVIVRANQIDGFGKRPSLWIGTEEPNAMIKVASFASDDKAQLFCKWLDYMFGLKDEEPTYRAWEEQI